MPSFSLLAPWCTAVVALLVYGLTVAPDLTWANFGRDGGELITAAFTLGVPHPPGYPTYVLLAHLFSYLPIEPIALRFNLFSAVCMAAAAGLVTAVNQQQLNGKQPLASVAAGLAFAFAPLVWSQAIISELYGLNLFCLALLLYLLAQQRPSGPIGFALGLCLTTHLTSLLMLPLVLLWTPWTHWRQLMLGLFLGLAPLLSLPLLAQTGSPVVWGQPQTAVGWWWLVTGQLYQANVAGLAATAVWPRLLDWGPTLLAQFLGVGFACVGWRGFRLWQGRQNGAEKRERLWFWALLATAVAYLGQALLYNTADAILYTLPAWLLTAVLLGPSWQRWGGWSLLLPLLLLLLHFPQQTLRHDAGVRATAVALLAQSPADAVLLSADEATTFTLWYFHFVEGRRPDVVLVDTNLFAFAWYRQRLGTMGLLFVPEDDDLATFYRLNQATRPLCQMQIRADQSFSQICSP